jgi:hypothetical protein
MRKMGMGMIKFIRALPQPLRSLYILAFVVLIFGMITFAFRAAELARWSIGSIGIVAFLIGLTVITNFRGAARGLAEGIKNYEAFGVDYSKSLMASTAFARIFGAMSVFVGAMFIYLGFFASDFRLG